jgi:predicted aspartyl protease
LPPGNICRIHLNRHPTPALVDTGACRSLVSENFLRRLKGVTRISNYTVHENLITANSAKMVLTGKVILEVKIAGIAQDFEFYIAPSLYFNVILGVDFLRHCKAQICMDTDQMVLFGGLCAVSMTGWSGRQIMLQFLQIQKLI